MIEHCRWPALDEPYRSALEAAVAEVFARCDPAGIVAAGPDVSPAHLRMLRYGVATLLEEALDIADRDPEMCAALLANAVDMAARYPFWAAGRWLPRHKELLHALDALDPTGAELARQFYRASDQARRMALARRVVQHAVGAVGFFEWEAEVEPVP
jgi:hypothetical protein